MTISMQTGNKGAKTMKKTLFISIMALVALTLLGFKGYTHYDKKGYVCKVQKPCNEYPEGLVTFQDANGHKWSFEGSEDWLYGDTLTATMNDNGTPYTIKDDYIDGSIIYTGWLTDKALATGEAYKYIY